MKLKQKWNRSNSPHPPSKENPDGWVQLFHGYIVTVRRQFTFYHKALTTPLVLI